MDANADGMKSARGDPPSLTKYPETEHMLGSRSSARTIADCLHAACGLASDDHPLDERERRLRRRCAADADRQSAFGRKPHTQPRLQPLPIELGADDFLVRDPPAGKGLWQFRPAHGQAVPVARKG